ncbi:MAG: arginase family protein [Candidatus Aenigmarchaeota archaeon]|nr:arginase family protein [Candidatus Aenigmarchaeota archaeon]
MLYTSRTFPLEYPLAEADVVLAGVPWDSTEIGKSVKHGPLFIREALKGLEGFDPETGVHVFAQAKPCDLGDVEVVPGNWGLTKERITDTVRAALVANPTVFPIVLGGDHLITLGILESLVAAHGKLTVVHFDAHRDLSPDWLGEPYAHITWGYHAIKSLGVRLVQLGVRSSTEEEHALIRELPVTSSLAGLEGPVYLTVDLDVFDPGFAPEVGTPEPLGMSPPEFFALLRQVCQHRLVGMDIVECAADRVNTPTALLGAQIIKKVLVWRGKR